MKNTARTACLLLLVASAAPLGGCIAVAAGAAAGYGAHKVASNEMTREYPAGLTATWNATLASMRESGYPVGEGVAHGPNGGFVAVNDAKVTVERTGDVSSRVRIRIGTFDNANHRRRAASILDGIGRRIGGVYAP